MRMQVYSVFDQAVRAYLGPFHVRSRAEAIRSFIGAVNEGKNDFKANAKDYTLFYLGDYDDNEGVYYSAQPGPESVLTALQAVDVDVFPLDRQVK